MYTIEIPEPAGRRSRPLRTFLVFLMALLSASFIALTFAPKFIWSSNAKRTLQGCDCLLCVGAGFGIAAGVGVAYGMTVQAIGMTVQQCKEKMERQRRRGCNCAPNQPFAAPQHARGPLPVQDMDAGANPDGSPRIGRHDAEPNHEPMEPSPLSMGDMSEEATPRSMGSPNDSSEP